MKDKKLSDLTTGDVTRFMLKVLAGLLIFYGVCILIGWLTS